MKGDKKMITFCFVLGMVGALLIAASLALALTGCGASADYGKTSPPTEETTSQSAVASRPTDPTEGGALGKPAPGEITRIKLAEGLTIRNVDMVRPEGIEYILSMLDVDTYELVDPEHERAVAVMNEASTILEFYTGDELYGMAWVTDTCEVVVIVEGGGVWYTQTPAVDTVLITAEFGRET